MLAASTVEQVKNFSDIVSIIAHYVQLKPRGRNHLGLCPFHQEKTPSFTVSPDKQIWHCFGCHASGDHISFVMKIENMGFSEAVVQIANQVGIEVVEEEKTVQASESERERAALQEMLFLAREAFRAQLTPATDGYQYLEKRGITEATMQTFCLGYAPVNFDLGGFFQQKGFSAQLIPKTGLFYRNDQGQWFSRFRGRVLFPVMDARGRTVGFGGRLIQDNPNAAKYINSEENQLFNKRKLLYGLSQAQPAIRKAQSLILMEGYMDVIVAHQYGFANTVGVMGTALTHDHIPQIKRATNLVYLALDSDEAGQTAALKSYELLKSQDFNIKALNLPAKDPADFLAQQGAEPFAQALQQATSIMDLMLERACQKSDPQVIENIPLILDMVLPALKSEGDVIVRRHYIKKIATRLKIPEELIIVKLKKSSYNVRQDRFKPTAKQKNRYLKAEDFLIYLVASDRGLRKELLAVLNQDDLITAEAKEIWGWLGQTEKINRELLESITAVPIKKKLGQILTSDAGHSQESLSSWPVYVSILKQYHQEQRVQVIKERLKEAEEQGLDEEVKSLLQELQGLQTKKSGGVNV